MKRLRENTLLSISSTLHNNGTRIPINDVLDRRLLHERGGTLSHADRHFQQVPQIDKIIFD